MSSIPTSANNTRNRETFKINFSDSKTKVPLEKCSINRMDKRDQVKHLICFLLTSNNFISQILTSNVETKDSVCCDSATSSANNIGKSETFHINFIDFKTKAPLIEFRIEKKN